MATAGWSHTVVLHLRNGDRLSGTVVASEASRITLSNSVIGKVVVALDQVLSQEPPPAALPTQPAEIRTNAFPVEAAALSLAVQRRLNELQATYLSGGLSAEEYHRRRALLAAEWAEANERMGGTGTPGVSRVAGGQLAAAGPVGGPTARPPARKYWTGDLQFGTDLGFSQKERQLYSGRLKLTYARQRVHEATDFLSTYGRTDGELSANRMDGSTKTDFDLSKRGYFYFLGGAGYDEIRKVDWRYELGPGFGFRLITRSNLTFRVEGGMQYQVQRFQDDREDRLYSQRLAEDLRWNLGKLFTFDEKVEYLPGVDSFGEYKLRAEVNLRYWLRSNLALTLTLIDSYDTVTANGVGQNDLQIRSTLGVKF